MIKLLATDLDGTLFYPKRKIKVLTKKNTKFLSEYITKGGHVILISGRHYDIAQSISKKVKAPVDMIACNGSAIYREGKVIEDSPMDKEEIKKFFNEHRNDKNIASWVFMTNKYPMIIIPGSMNAIERIFYRFGLFLQFTYLDNYYIGEKYLNEVLNDDTHIYKMMPIMGITKKSCEIARVEREKYVDAYGTKFEIFWSNQSIEFMNKGVNKANALKKFINVLELKEDEVAVIGDSGNDIPLFEEFENSYVMSQAPAEVKKYAKTEIKGVYCLKDYID